LDAAEDAEEAAQDAYDAAVEAGGPDLGPDEVADAGPVEEAGAPAADKEDAGLSKREVKAMKPPQLKEHLKELGLSVQGSKADLLSRLLAALEL